VKKIPVEYTSIDVPYNKMFALSDETKAYVKALDQDVTIYVWGSRNLTDTTLTETLDRFADSSSHIKVNFITPT
jgi:ABC-2 type transport system permease protein